MNWTEAMKNHGAMSGLDLAARSISDSSDVATQSWDPFEVWLTRIKRPRDQFAEMHPDETSGSARHTAGS